MSPNISAVPRGLLDSARLTNEGDDAHATGRASGRVAACADALSKARRPHRSGGGRCCRGCRRAGGAGWAPRAWWATSWSSPPARMPAASRSLQTTRVDLGSAAATIRASCPAWTPRAARRRCPPTSSHCLSSKPPEGLPRSGPLSRSCPEGAAGTCRTRRRYQAALTEACTSSVGGGPTAPGRPRGSSSTGWTCRCRSLRGPTARGCCATRTSTMQHRTSGSGCRTRRCTWRR